MPVSERRDYVETPEEFATLGHLRGWCHDGRLCAICAAERRGSAEAIRVVAEG